MSKQKGNHEILLIAHLSLTYGINEKKLNAKD